MRPLFALSCVFFASQGFIAEAKPIIPPYGYFFPSVSPAETEVQAQRDSEAAKKKRAESISKSFHHRLQIGADYTRVNLKPHGSSTFSGNLGGLQGIYEYRPMDRFYGAAKLAWKEGDTHGSSGKRSLLYIDTQERLGYTFGFHSGDWRLTLFSGFGYRHYGQKLSPKHGSNLKFDYNEFYIPVGFLTDYAFNSWFSLGLNFTWMPQVFPTVEIRPLKGARWDLTYKLANFLVELPFTFIFTDNKRWAVVFNPFYERWQDGHSFAKTSSGLKLSLPGNTYNFYGADLNLAYSF